MLSKLFEIYNFTKRSQVFSWMTQEKLLSDNQKCTGTARKPHLECEMKVEKRKTSIDVIIGDALNVETRKFF